MIDALSSQKLFGTRSPRLIFTGIALSEILKWLVVGQQVALFAPIQLPLSHLPNQLIKISGRGRTRTRTWDPLIKSEL